jgi:hypothetical protein
MTIALARQASNCARHCACAALALAMLTTTVAFAEEGGSAAAASTKAPANDTVGDAGHAAQPPAANAADTHTGNRGAEPAEAHRHGARSDRDADTKRDASRLEHGTKSGIDRGNKAGPPSVGTLDNQMVAPVRQLPRTSARDRLFKKIEATKVTPAVRPHPYVANSTAMTGPPRNAIGIASLDANPAAHALNAMHPGLPSPGGGGGTGSTRIGAITPIPGSWHPGLAPAAAPGAINGTAVVRLGSGPAVVGGAAQVVTGINGTTIRPKH